MPKKSDKEKKKDNKGNDSDDTSSPKPSKSTTKDERRSMFQEGASGSGEGHESRSDKKAKGDDRKTGMRKRSSQSVTAPRDAHQSSHLPKTDHLGEPESCASPLKRNRLRDTYADIKDKLAIASPKKTSSKGSEPSSSTTALKENKDGIQSTSSSDPSVAEYFRRAESGKSAPDQGAEVDSTSPSVEGCIPKLENCFSSCWPTRPSDAKGSSELPCTAQSNPETAAKGKYQTRNQVKLEASSSSGSPLSKKSSDASTETSLLSSSHSDPIVVVTSKSPGKSQKKTGSSSTSKDHDPLEGGSGMHIPPESDRELRSGGAKRTPRIDQGNEDPNLLVPRSSSRSKRRSPSPRPKCNCSSSGYFHKVGCPFMAYNQREVVAKPHKNSARQLSSRNKSTEVVAERRKNKKTGEKSESELSSTEE